MHRQWILAAAIAMQFTSPGVRADDASWDFSGDVALETRIFTQDALWAGQDDAAVAPAAEITAEFRWRNAAGNQRGSVIPFARLDATDDERSLFDLREAYWAYEGDDFEVLVGVNTVFWGVTESVHLVDIVNQTDSVADIDGEDKLGQPMINVALQRDWGQLSVFVLPYFRERTFAGSDGRFRAPLPVDADRPAYESSDGENHVDFAVRYSHYIGNVDIGVSWFSGTSREARFAPGPDGSALLPHFDQIDQVGVDLQYTGDAWLWKLEAMLRDGRFDTFAAAVGGFEYTYYQVRGSAADVGLLLEYQSDDRSKLEPITTADNDVFLGSRLALNDAQDTSLLAGVAYDLNTSETFVNIEGERRFGDDIVIEMRARLFSGATPGDSTYPVSRDDYIELNIAKYF